MKDISRFINFSDAVIAIAVTLLVLPLAEHAANVHINSYHAFAAAFGRQLLIFLLSFIVVCRYWEIHHDLLNSVRTFNAQLFWLNALWLASIVLIPFVSEVIVSSSGPSAPATGIYIGTLLITSYVSIAMEWLVAHSPQLQKSSADKALHVRYGLPTAVAMTMALLLSLLIHGLGPWTLLILIPAGYLDKYMHKDTSTYAVKKSSRPAS